MESSTSPCNQQTSCLHPSTKLYRFLILVFVSLLTFGSYFAYDIIGGIAPTLVEEIGATFRNGDFKDFPRFIKKLREAQDPVSLHLRTNFSKQIQAQLATGEQISETDLMKELNHWVLDRKAAYDSKVFSQVIISAETKSLLEKEDIQEMLKKGRCPADLHRSLLEDAYPDEIAKNLAKNSGSARKVVGTLYTMYSIAAIVAVFIAGILIDWLGIRKSSMLFSLLVLFGASVVAFAQSMSWLFVGRFIFGAGSEPLVVAQSAMIARWFKGKEIALAFGIALTVSRLGTLFSFNTGELIVQRYGNSQSALIASVIFCAISLLANVIYLFLDKHGERELKFSEPTSQDSKIVIAEIKNFRLDFWCITFLCFTFYSAIFPFSALSTDFFADKWKIKRVAESEGGFFYQVFSNFLHMFHTAGGVSSIIIFASMVCAPFAGYFVDKFGKRASLMILGSLIMIPSHLMMGFTNIYPAYSMITLGIAFVLVPAAMWPSVPLIVRKESVGTAFGLITAIQNIGLALFPYLNGLLRDYTKSYSMSQIMFASLGAAGLIFALLLKYADHQGESVLEKP